MSALSAFAQGSKGAIGGFMSTYEFMQKMQDRNRALEAEKMFGTTLQSMYGPQPGEATGAPTQLQMPGAQPMPPPGMRPPPMMAPSPRTGAPMQQPMQAGSPPPMGMPSPGGPPPSPSMQPTNDFGGGGPSSAPLPNAPEGQTQRPPPQLDWRSVLTALSKKMPPGTDPAIIARVTDRLLPMMNSQSQMEWRDISAKIKALETQRKTDQGDRGLDIRQQGVDARKAGLAETKRYHDSRLSQIDTQLQKAGVDRLPAATKATLDMHTNLFKQADTTLRVAKTNLTRMQTAFDDPDPADMAAAKQDVAEAQAAADAAQQGLVAYTKTILPKANLNFDAPTAEPEVAPSKAPPKQAASQVAPTTPPGNAKFSKTKGGATAQVSGYESPQYLPQTKPKGTGVAAAASAPPPAKTPVVSAQPSASAKAIPMPKSKAMLVKGQLYDTRFGPATWDGTKFVSAKNGPKAK